VKPDISEFSYGYALTSELVRRFGFKSVGAPVFPSLVEEGHLGYDVKIPGVPLFLQFKLSDEMVRGTAKEAGLLGVPHFRMHLRPLRHSQQHNLLLDLERAGHAVYYAAPEFSTPADLNDAYNGKTVADRSVFWSPREIGPLPDDYEHYIVFRVGDAHGYFCSEPKFVERTGAESLLRRARDETPVRDERLPSRNYFLELTEQLVEIYSQREPAEASRFERSRTAIRDRDPEDDAAIAAQMLFGCALLFAFRA
jgi:hypothetical protein